MDKSTETQDKQELTLEQFGCLLQEDAKLSEQHEELLAQGYTFLWAEEYYVYGNARSTGPTGKIVETTYKQPTKSDVVYSEDIYNTIADLNNPIQVLLGCLPKYIWIPATLFGISSSTLSDYLSTGRNEITVNGNLHSKVAYYYDAASDKYWAGYEAQMMVSAVTVACEYTKSNGDPYHESTSRNYTYVSPNYFNDSYLFSMAVEHWDDDVYYWETYEVPSRHVIE